MFSYYERLSATDKRTYRQSDEVHAIRLRQPRALQPLVEPIRQALAAGDRPALEAATGRLCERMTDMLGVDPVDVEVLLVRPRSDWGELHGLYWQRPGMRPRIQVWMRTAAKGRVVAFRTYLRTVLHELCHHMDVTLLGLPRSFHTQGFFQRESSLFHQLVPRPPKGRRARKAAEPQQVQQELLDVQG